MNDIELKSYLPLLGKEIVIATSGSLSVYRVPDLVRDLRREGANVRVAMSPDSAKLVSPELMKWASGNDVATGITGNVEHISLLEGGNKTLLIVPATYNTIGKMASGITDSVTTALFSHAIGNGNPVIAVPVMHLSMFTNPVMTRNMEFLREIGVRFVNPVELQGKAKIPANDSVIDETIRSFAGVQAGKKVLVITGNGYSEIDPVRVITNRSSGETGYWLSRALYRMGNHVTVLGNVPRELPQQIKISEAFSVKEYFDGIKSLLKEAYDMVVVPAAIPDFMVEKSSKKLSSSTKQEIQLVPQAKLLEAIRKLHRGVVVPFRLTSKDDRDHLEHFREIGAEAVVANHYDTGTTPFGSGRGMYLFVSPGSEEEIIAETKEESCSKIASLLAGLVS